MVSGSSDLINKTVTIILSGNQFKASGGHIQNSVVFNGQTVPADLEYDTTSACNGTLGSTRYYFDIESWDQTNGIVITHVLNPTLSHTVDWTPYVCYNDATVTTYQGGTVGQAYDSHFISGLHFANGTSLSLYDFITGVQGTGVNTPGVSASGQIDGAATFDHATNNYVHETVTTSISAYSYSFWFNPTSTPTTGVGAVFTGYQISNSLGWNYDHPSSSYQYAASHQDASTNWHGSQCAAPTVGSMNFIYVTWDGSNLTCYLNASPNTPVSVTNGLYAPVGDMAVGGNSLGSDSVSATVDEVQYMNTSRSQDWITTEYRNQGQYGTYVTQGSEQGGGGGARHKVVISN
jgi:hypothetical protein